MTQLDAPEAAESVETAGPSTPTGEPAGTPEAPPEPEDSPRRRRRLGRRGVVVLIGALLLLTGAGYGAYALFSAGKSTPTTQYRP